MILNYTLIFQLFLDFSLVLKLFFFGFGTLISFSLTTVVIYRMTLKCVHLKISILIPSNANFVGLSYTELYYNFNLNGAPQVDDDIIFF